MRESIEDKIFAFRRDEQDTIACLREELTADSIIRAAQHLIQIRRKLRILTDAQMICESEYPEAPMAFIRRRVRE